MDGQEYRLLKYFIANDSLTITELTAQFQISKRTMQKYIKELNADLKGIAVVRDNQQRFYLKIYDYNRLTSLQTGFLKQSLDFNDPQKRQAFIILKLIQADDFIILDDLAEQLVISKGTLNRDIHDLKQSLQEYQTEIISVTNKGVRLVVTHDYDYGLLLLNFVYDYYPLSAVLADEHDKFVLEGLIRQLDATEHTVTLVEKNLIVLAVLFQYKRRLKMSIPFYQELVSEEKLAPLIQQAEKLLHTQLTTTEKAFLCYPLNIKLTNVTDKVKLEQRLKWVHHLFDNVQQTIRRTLNSHLDLDHVFIQIRYHLLFMVNRIIFKAQTENLLSNEVIEKYPVALELALLTARSLEQQLHLKIPEVESNYLTIYYQMEIEEQHHRQVNKKAAIVGPVSRSIKKFIMHQLNDLFQDTIEIVTFMSVLELQQTQEHYLIVFSNQPIQLDDPSIPIVRLNSAFRTDELLSKVQTAQVEEAINQGWCHFRITRLNAQLGYLKGTETLIKQEIARGQLNETFLTDWYQREKQTNNIFENKIAIPHMIDHSGAKRILLTVGIFDKIVAYQQRQVQLIFLIGIPSQLDPQINRALSQVYDLIFTISRHQNIYSNLLNYNDQQSLTQITEGI
ncbi:MAG: HTH domain-containing protein [Lactobacillus sp.]|nr:MAG: HTH domain-containing protein [Lactobacillus sp.]